MAFRGLSWPSVAFRGRGPPLPHPLGPPLPSPLGLTLRHTDLTRAVSSARTWQVRISDEGGGIALAEASSIWRYAYTTAPTPLVEVDDDAQSNRPPQTLRRSALAGYGMGLPLSRLYAQYLGGRLDLRSLEGHGTDAFLHLPRLGAACETLPAVVRASPAERDSTPGSMPGRRRREQYSVGDLSEYEYAVLSEKLAEIRH